jgi:hypothetical protein
MIWLYLTWLPVYLEHERHFSIARVGWILGIPYVFGTFGSCPAATSRTTWSGGA